VEIDWSAIGAALPDLLDGVKLTVFIAFVGLVGGFIVGMIAGMFRAYGPTVLNVLAQVYIELIRGTPIVVQVMFLYFALPVLAHIRIDGLTAAIIAITVNSGLSCRSGARRIVVHLQGPHGSRSCDGSVHATCPRS
jgi:glutamine transport system permease protein